MSWLVLGVLLWSIAHLTQCLLPGIRAGLIDRVGENTYKGLFSLLIVASLVLMVLGWRGATPYSVYSPPQWGHSGTVVLMVAALILFFASRLPTNIKRVLRHPQLTGFALWAVAHMLSNGDQRSIVLFGGLVIWSILQIVLINRRDGAWIRPTTVPVSKDIAPIVIGIAVYAVLFWLHPYFAGIPLM